MKISGSLISHHTTNHENIEEDQLPVVHADSLLRPTVSSWTRLPVALLPDPSNEQCLKGLCKNSLEALVSEIIDLKSFPPISPSPVSYLRETQLTAYRRAEKLRSATENRILPRIDMYL